MRAATNGALSDWRAPPILNGVTQPSTDYRYRAFMTPRRRRVIAGEYSTEVAFIWERLLQIPGTRTKFPLIYTAYSLDCRLNRVRPVTPCVFGSVLRREALQMKDVWCHGTRPVVWRGLRL